CTRPAGRAAGAPPAVSDPAPGARLRPTMPPLRPAGPEGRGSPRGHEDSLPYVPVCAPGLRVSPMFSLQHGTRGYRDGRWCGLGVIHAFNTRCPGRCADAMKEDARMLRLHAACLVIAAIVVLAPRDAHAHFMLNSPASWMSLDSQG